MVKVEERLKELARLASGLDSSEEKRLRIAEGLREILEAELTPEQREIANDIARRLSLDVAAAVRQTLVDRLASCRFLTREAAMKLARDLEIDSGQLLSDSPVFTDADLVELATSLRPAGLRALAARAELPGGATRALAERGDASVAKTLARNRRCRLSDEVFDLLIDRFSPVVEIMDSLAQRRDAPLTVLKRLVDVVSAEMQDRLVTDHALGPDLAAYLVEDARRHTLIAIIARSSDPQVEKLVRHLDAKGELTPIFVLYAMKEGATRFFELVLAVRNAITLDQVRLAMDDPDSRRVMRLVDQAELGQSMLKEYQRLLQSNRARAW